VVAGDYEYGLAAYQARDYQKAFRLLKPLAEQGHATAQSNPGMMYDKGDGVPQDAAKALFWLTRAAEQGDAAGQYDLGSLYEYGDGVPQDTAKAIYWHTKAAGQGFTNARYTLVLYMRKAGEFPVTTPRQSSTIPWRQSRVI
jgi:hypothetical protein